MLSKRRTNLLLHKIANGLFESLHLDVRVQGVQKRTANSVSKIDKRIKLRLRRESVDGLSRACIAAICWGSLTARRRYPASTTGVEIGVLFVSDEMILTAEP